MADAPSTAVPRYADMGHQRVDKVFRLGAFFYFFNQPVNEKDATGWKFHFTADEAHLEAAWDGVARAMIDHGVGQAKVIGRENVAAFNDPDNKQAGKMITVYDHGEKVDWQAFVQDVENRLLTAGVRPGPGVKGDRPVPGSLYAAYRNDKDAQGEYASAAAIRNNPEIPAANRHNPHGFSDPLADLTISHGAYLADFGEWEAVASLERDGKRQMANTGLRVDVTDKSPAQKAALIEVLGAQGLAPDAAGNPHPDIMPDYVSRSSGRNYLVVFSPSDAVVAKALTSHAQDKAQKSARELVPDLQKAVAGAPEAQASSPALANERVQRGGQGMSR